MAVLRLLPDVEQDVRLLRHHHALAHLHTESGVYFMLHRLLWVTCSHQARLLMHHKALTLLLESRHLPSKTRTTLKMPRSAWLQVLHGVSSCGLYTSTIGWIVHVLPVLWCRMPVCPCTNLF